jgi:hypothetical protein
MTPPAPAGDPLPRLRRLSAVMCIAIPAVAALTMLALVLVWLSPHQVSTLLAPRLGLADAALALDARTRLLGFLVSMIPVSVLFAALYDAHRLFLAFRAGHAVSSDAAVRLRRIGMAMLAIAVLRPITGAILSALLTAANAPGQQHLVLGISSDDWMIATFGGLVLAIGHVMVEAARLADENRQFV